MRKDNSIKHNMIERQLSTQIDEGNFEKIHGVLNSATQNHVASTTVLNKYVELAAFYNSGEKYRESIELLLDAIQLSPTSSDIFNSLGENLACYVTQYNEDFCDEDIRWAGTAVEFLFSINDSARGAQHQLNRNPGIQKIIRVLRKLKQKNDGKAESPHTHFLSSISLKQYQSLTPEERRQKVAELFARKLLELEKAKKGKGGNSDA